MRPELFVIWTAYAGVQMLVVFLDVLNCKRLLDRLCIVISADSQNRPPPKQNRQNRQGNILQYISNGNSKRANYGNILVLFSLYIF